MLGGICDQLGCLAVFSRKSKNHQEINYLQRASGKILALPFPVLEAQF